MCNLIEKQNVALKFFPDCFLSPTSMEFAFEVVSCDFLFPFQRELEWLAVY